MTQEHEHGESPKARRGGRPSKGPRRKLAFRATPELEKKLEQAAGNYRSLSEEVELRLEQSFAGPKVALLVASFGSEKVAKILEMIGLVARVAEERTGQTADQSLETFEVVLRAAELLMRDSFAIAPGEQRQPDLIKECANDVFDLTRRIFHEPNRALLSNQNRPIWAKDPAGNG